MKIFFSLLMSFIVTLSLGGCKKNTVVQEKAPVLTVEDFKYVRNSIGPFSSFDAGIKKAVQKLGKPHKKEGRRSYWYVKDDKACTEFFIEEMGGNMIGGTGITPMEPGTYMFSNCPVKY